MFDCLLVFCFQIADYNHEYIKTERISSYNLTVSYERIQMLLTCLDTVALVLLELVDTILNLT